jgi:MFS family permease
VAAALPFVVYLGGMPSGPVAGYLSDRFGAGRLLLIAGLLTGPVIFLLSQVDSVLATVPVFLALGALMFTLMPVSELYIINHSPESKRSTVLGVYYAASRGGSGFLTIGLGVMIENLGFGHAFTIAGAAMLGLMVLCLAFIWLERRVTGTRA